MGMKSRKPPRERPPITNAVTLKRSDGYSLIVKQLSYEAGLAVATVINRAHAGLAVKVSWEDSDGTYGEVKLEGA